MNLDFAKLHALGNDFLIMRTGETGDLPQSLSSLARALCDRHRGIGADGTVFYQLTVADAEAEVAAIIFNADGSRAEVSGNGLRCLAACLHACGVHRNEVLRVRTVSGVRAFELRSCDGREYVYESRMGIPILEAERIPALLGSGQEPVLDYPLDLNGKCVRITATSLGNPHCSVFWSDLDDAPVEKLGPLLEQHAAFPQKTNVEFAQVLDRHSIKLRFWERGVGRTLASGTGSAAAAVASMLLGYCESPVTVQTDLGSMTVTWQPGGEVRLTGPAEIICYGTYPAPGSGQEPA